MCNGEHPEYRSGRPLKGEAVRARADGVGIPAATTTRRDKQSRGMKRHRGRRRMFLRGAGALSVALVLVALHSAAAQSTFPTRQITIVVPTAAGGAADGAARTVANQLSIIAKQPVIVDNRPGAGGMLAAMYVAKAEPDGYTILLGTNSTHAANVSLFKNLQYDPIKDFAPITRAESAPAFLVVNADSSIKSVADFLGTVRR
jgi:tripartite-type tricarboxylate transporter receptor subunit TctC